MDTKSAQMMNKDAKIYVAGHNGMVGSAIVRLLEKEGYNNLVLRSSKELDLRNQKAVNSFFESESIDFVFLAAAKVGGIMANSAYKGTFLYDNLMIQNNVMEAAKNYQVKKLLFLGSSCIYPKFAEQPIRENALLTGALEPTNEAYAIAKIAGLKMCDYYREEFGCNFISLMPTNLYGPNDNYDLNHSHVIPALLRKFHEAKLNKSLEVELWGNGSPLREFLHVDDLAEASIFSMINYNQSGHLNVGSGKELSIKELAELITFITDYQGEIKWDTTKPNGTPRKIMDSSKIMEFGWEPKTSLKEGLRQTYEAKFNASV